MRCESSTQRHTCYAHVYLQHSILFRWTDLKNLPRRLYTPSLCTYNTGFFDFIHRPFDPLLPFFLLILTAVIANARQIFSLASLVYRSDAQSAPIYILQWLMPSSLCQGRQKKSTLRRLTGTDNLFTPTDKTWPDCYLFVRDGKMLSHNS